MQYVCQLFFLNKQQIFNPDIFILAHINQYMYKKETFTTKI
jgi:hypothetical protein